jgi:hypothetical protein
MLRQACKSSPYNNRDVRSKFVPHVAYMRKRHGDIGQSFVHRRLDGPQALPLTLT